MRGELPSLPFVAPAALAGPAAPTASPAASTAVPPAGADLKEPSREPQVQSDDRAGIRQGERVLLIVEDDASFAAVLTELARKHGFKSLVATSAASALSLARESKPAAITLDLHLPDWDGWVVLDRLKHDPSTSHIPVHVISVEDDEERSLRSGAFAYLKKPATREALEGALDEMKEFSESKVRNLLVVENDASERQQILELIGNGDVQTTAAGTAEEAQAALEAQRFDCIVLGELPDQGGLKLMERLRQDPNLRGVYLIVYTGKDHSLDEEEALARNADAVVIKGVRSRERLVAETALFLHRLQANLPPEQKRILEQFRRTDPIFAGRKVLIVDDDIRNIFALTTVIERHEMEVVNAESGKAALALLEKASDFDVVLMDIMMPDMDGFETIRRIRQSPEFEKLPIIALTAKAMLGDREKCLEAGASDYLSKPVDVEQLLSLMRVWLYR